MGFLTQLNGIDFGTLGLLPRLLLISDGTLTDIVEAAFLEPIGLKKIDTETVQTTEPVEELQLAAGSSLMRRRILLRGETTGTTYVYAETLIALDALDSRFREDLVNSTHPLGRLWVMHKLETRKEILRVWPRPAGELGERFGMPAEAPFVARSYRVISGGRPIMLITECFPAAARPS
jgi:chorismate-pyruvate lyase